MSSDRVGDIQVDLFLIPRATEDRNNCYLALRTSADCWTREGC